MGSPFSGTANASGSNRTKEADNVLNQYSPTDSSRARSHKWGNKDAATGLHRASCRTHSPPDRDNGPAQSSPNNETAPGAWARRRHGRATIPTLAVARPLRTVIDRLG